MGLKVRAAERLKELAGHGPLWRRGWGKAAGLSCLCRSGGGTGILVGAKLRLLKVLRSLGL